MAKAREEGAEKRPAATPQALLPSLNELPRVTLFDTVADRLEEWILSGELEVGARLPAEEALSSHFGVSRTVVREALARLRDRGLVETRTGSGTVVRGPDPAHLQDALLRHLKFSTPTPRFVEVLYQARMAIEVSTARLAATWASDRELDEIAAQVETMQQSRGDRAAFTRSDLGFHQAIATASHNPLLAALLSPLVSVIEEGIHETFRSVRATQDGLRGHNEILSALRKRRPDEAAAAMQDHLAVSQEHFERAFTKMRRGAATAAVAKA